MPRITADVPTWKKKVEEGIEGERKCLGSAARCAK